MTVPTEITERITSGRHSAHLATAVDDRPHVAPVWYVYEDGVVSLLTGGRKLANVRRNPRVALSIEEADESGVEWRVVLLGTATAVDDPERARAVARRVFARYYDDPATATEDDADEPDGTLVEVRVGSADLETY